MLLLIAILALLWLLGTLLFHFAGFVLHLLIIAAVVLFAWHLIKGARSAT